MSSSVQNSEASFPLCLHSKERKESGSPKTEMDGVVLLNNDFQVLHRFKYDSTSSMITFLNTLPTTKILV